MIISLSLDNRVHLFNKTHFTNYLMIITVTAVILFPYNCFVVLIIFGISFISFILIPSSGSDSIIFTKHTGLQRNK